MFDLAVEGVTRLRRLAPFSEKSVAWEALAGLVDGINTYFRVRRPPVKDDSLTVYVSGSTASHTLTDPNLVTLSSPPVAQPYANYIHQPLTTRQAKQLLMDGVTELEMRWSRGLRLSSSSASYAAATEDDSHIYVVGASSVADPSDDVNLSDREAQKGVIVQCAYYVYRLSELISAARNAVSVRGTAGGMTLDRRAIPTALLQAMARLEMRLDKQINDAAIEWTGGSSLGGYIAALHTRDYYNEYEWLSSSKLEDWAATYRYQHSDVDLEAI